MTSTNSSLKFLGDESLVKMISNGYMWWHDERLNRSFIRRKLLSPQPQRLVHFFGKKIKISRLSLPLSKPHCIAPWSTEPNLHSYEHIYRFIISLHRLQMKYAWERWWYLKNYVLYNRDSKLLWRPTWKVEKLVPKGFSSSSHSLFLGWDNREEETDVDKHQNWKTANESSLKKILYSIFCLRYRANLHGQNLGRISNSAISLDKKRALSSAWK